VLVGTVSIEKSEKLSGMLDRRGLKRGTTTGGGSDKHVVLNAKYHAQEAEFVAQAGRKAAVTIATNMAGRGTDILLGGNPEFMARQQCLAEQIAERLPKGEERFVEDEQYVYFYHLDAFYRVPKAEYSRIYDHFKRLCDVEHDEVVALGGLHIVATERHEARRIDNQLRGRAGRQGDPGASRFYLSLEDDLMRIFGSDRISGLMQRLGMEEGVPIEHGMVTRAIERAQKQVESQNFSVRKHLLEYDDVMNKQRENIYGLRRQILEGHIRLKDENDEETALDTREYLMELAEDQLDSIVETYAPRTGDIEEWDLDAVSREVGAPTKSATSSGRSPSSRTSRRRSWSAARFSGASSATSCCRSSTSNGRTICTASIISRKGSGCAAMGSAIRSSSTRKKASISSRR
jgi:preprotein translocase subunit SecA